MGGKDIGDFFDSIGMHVKWFEKNVAGYVFPHIPVGMHFSAKGTVGVRYFDHDVFSVSHLNGFLQVVRGQQLVSLGRVLSWVRLLPSFVQISPMKR